MLFITLGRLAARSARFVPNPQLPDGGSDGLLLKLSRVMKLTAFLLLIFALHVSAKTYSQRVTYSGNNVSLEKVFEVIEKQTGYVVFYDYRQIQGARPVTVDVKDEPLTSFLDRCFKSQPFGFAIEDKTIMITKLESAAAPPSIKTADVPPPPDIHGYVTDSLGRPLAGATIMVKGSKKGTVTDAKGEFVLKVTDENPVLVISFTGYNNKEYKVRDNSNFRIILSSLNSPLDNVQVIAYGTNTRRYNVGAVSTITAEDIDKQPVSNVLLAMEGRVAGLTVNPSSGAPGSSVKIQVRGQNSLASNSTTANSIAPFDQPLFIVDGVPFAPQNQNINSLPYLGGGGFNPTNITGLPTQFSGGASPFNSISPNDIESISILKDADATSIYGSQGANGVVVITTKKGKAGKTSLNMNVYTAGNTTTSPVKMLNTQQYVQLREEAIKNDGLPLTPAYASLFPDIMTFDTTKYTDWFHQFYGRSSSTTNAHASLSGGSANTTFIASVGYNHSGYNFPGNYANDMMTLHTGVHHASLDRRLTIDFGSDFSYGHNNSSAAPSASRALLLPPNLPNLIDPLGNLAWSYKGVDLTNYQMYGYIKQPSDLKSYNMNDNLRFSYRVITGLNINANVGYSQFLTDESGEYPISSQPPGKTSYASFAQNNFQTINAEPTIDYTTRIGRGQLSLLAGGTYKKSITNNHGQTGYIFPNDDLIGSIGSASQITASNGTGYYKYSAVYGRAGYIWDRKYIINLTGRRDGSSNFGPGHQFGSFGSVGLGWIFSEEETFKRTLPFISYGKLSGNYGTNGSDGVAPYNYQSFWKTSGSTSTFQGTRGYQPSNLYNPNYSWDQKKAWNAAVDLGFFHDRLLVNGTWYLNKVGSQLIGYTLPSQTGFNSVVKNFEATVQNRGWEFSLTSTNIKGRDFTWSMNFNLSMNRNKLVAFPGLATSPYASLYTIGKSTSIVNGFRLKGVNDTTGYFQFYTAKGDVTNRPNATTIAKGGDMAPIADLQPKFYGGFGNTFTYKGISLTLFFQFSKQEGLNYYYDIYNSAPPGGLTNEPVEALNHWRKKGDHSNMQRATIGYDGNALIPIFSFLQSTGVYSDASYIRLKTLSLSYSLPASWLKSIHMQHVSLYMNAQNLLTITGYKVGDPELPGNLFSIPMQRTVAGGINFDF